MLGKEAEPETPKGDLEQGVAVAKEQMNEFVNDNCPSLTYKQVTLPTAEVSISIDWCGLTSTPRGHICSTVSQLCGGTAAGLLTSLLLSSPHTAPAYSLQCTDRIRESAVRGAAVDRICGMRRLRLPAGIRVIFQSREVSRRRLRQLCSHLFVGKCDCSLRDLLSHGYCHAAEPPSR